MLFSIVVPIYKVEEYIDRCMKSLLSQTYEDIEIILVDDGSPDRCPEICDAYAERDSRVRVIHKENGGLSDARNAGLWAATGDYIIYLDSDDFIDRDACRLFSEYTKEMTDILVGDLEIFGGVNYFEHDASLKDRRLSGEEYLVLAREANLDPAPAWLNVYRRGFLLENKLFFKKGILHEDEEFMPRVFLAAKSVVYTGINFYRYVIRENSITTAKDKTKNARHVYDICKELEELYKPLKNKKLKRLLRDRLARLYLSLYHGSRLAWSGREFTKRRFVLRNAKRLKTRIAAFIYFISPKLYSKTVN